MKVLWETDRDGLAARDVYGALPSRVGWAYQTVKTLLSRLVHKGALTYDQVGNSYLYKTVFSRREHAKRELDGMVERMFDGAASPAIEAIIRDAKLSEDDINKLQQVLEEKARRKQGR